MNLKTKHICRLITILLMLLKLTNANSVELPSYIVILPADSEKPNINDSCLWEMAYPIYFKVNKAEISRKDPHFIDVVKSLKGLGKQFSLCKLILIRSSSSPEGGYTLNERLAHRRARALVDSLKRHIVIPDSTIEERYMHEDYEGLRRMLLKSKASYRDKVVGIIESNRGDDKEIKRRLMELEAGKIWKSLLRDFYPRLRAARILIFVTRNFEYVDFNVPKTPIPTIAVKPPEEWPYPLTHKPLYLPKATPEPVASPRPMFNIKTNLLYDLALVIPQYGWAPSPNVSLEFLPRGGHLTAVAEYIGSGWRNDRKLKTWIIHDLLLEARYYFRGKAAFTGHYLAAYANTARYDIQFSAEKAWLSKCYGDTWGAGIGWGYVRRIGKSRWKWEANLAVGLLNTHYDRYHPAEEWAEPDRFYYNWHDAPELFVKLRNKFNYIGLTRLGFSLSYDLPWLEWKNRKGGRR